MKIDNSGPPYFINTFDQALNWIGAKPNGETREQPTGQARSGQTRDAAPEPTGLGPDPASDGVLLRFADVRAVRREERVNPATGVKRQVVVVSYVASTEDIDSYESILTCDWNEDGRLDDFKRNPVILWSHNSGWGMPVPAIGHAENVRVENRKLLLDVVCDDTTPFDREIAEKLAKGVLRAGSVGFAPGDCELIEIDGREIIRYFKNKLREFSVCNVGSNSSALAQSQREFVGLAREMARAAGGKIAMDQVVARYKANTLTRTVSPALPAPVQPTAAPAAGDTMKDRKRIDIDARAVRSDGEGMSADASCPHCNEPVEVNARSVPTPKKATDEIATLTERATKAEQALTRETAEKDAVEKRAALLDTKLATAEQTIQRMREDRVSAEIELRVGKKLDPTEKDDQVRLALLDLANQTPDPEQPTRTLGDKAFAARLAKIDARRDIGLLGAPITAGGKENQNANAPAVRSIADKIDSAVAEDLKHK